MATDSKVIVSSRVNMSRLLLAVEKSLALPAPGSRGELLQLRVHLPPVTDRYVNTL